MNQCKELLEDNKHVILVSTQLIEAGVDIDFPMVFRDLCPLPSLIQTAGRGNRNGKKPRACIWLFELEKNGKSRAELIYRNEPHWFLNFCRDEILKGNSFKESELLPLQQKYFYKISHDLILGNHRLFIDNEPQSANIVEEINNLSFSNVGSFRLIDKEYGESFRYFVPQEEDETEDRFDQLQKIVEEATQAKRKTGGRLSYDKSKYYDTRLQTQLRQMAADIVQFRVPYGKKASAMECCGIALLSVTGDYNPDTGISFDGNAMAIF